MSKIRCFASLALLVLAGLGCARAEGPAAKNEAPGLSVDRGRPTPVADARRSVRDQQALHLLLLQKRHNARQQQIRALSNLQASHHELMMVIIDNMRPSGRYEYNPATGRYDRYVPDRR
jgi:hypothetical protein